MAIPALAPAMMAWSGENEIVAVVTVALTLEVSVIAGPMRLPTDADAVMADIKPALVVSRNVGVAIEKSFEVAAAMLVNAACAAVGVVNFVTVTVTRAAAGKVPAVSLMINTGLTNVTVHVEEGAVTEQTLVPSKAMPAPDSVMQIPALGPAVMAWVGVNEIVAVVCVAFAEEASVIEGKGKGAPPVRLVTRGQPV
jgi:hypothetical protein